MRWGYRLGQTWTTLRASHAAPPTLPHAAQRRLTEPMAIQFRTLQIPDQMHALDVYLALVAAGADDDTVTAGLLHDVGKACRACRISVIDRAANVVLKSVAPGLHRRLANRDEVPASLRGLQRLAAHPRRGALAAEQAGYNARVAWLIEHHEDRNPSDPTLRILQRADDGVLRPETSHT